MSQCIIVVMILYGAPCLASSMIRLHDDVTVVLAEHGVDPMDDAGANLEPVGVVGAHRGADNDMMLEIKLGEDGVEEVTPLTIVGVLKVQDNRDVCLDIHHLDSCRVDDGGP